MEQQVDSPAGTTGKPDPLKAVSAFRHRNYQLYFTGQLISLSGTWMQNIAQDWLVLDLTNSAFLLGVIAAIQFLPMLLLSLVAGEVADRVPKRPLLILTQGSMMLLAAPGRVVAYGLQVGPASACSSWPWQPPASTLFPSCCCFLPGYS